MKAILEGNELLLLQGDIASKLWNLEPQLLKVLCLCYDLRQLGGKVHHILTVGG